MTITSRLLAWAVVGVVTVQPLHAADSPERADLRAQRQTIETDYAAREQACLKQFVVTPCVEKVRLEKLDALEGIRQRENALDDAARLKRAQMQEQRIADKLESARRAAPTASSAAATAPNAAVSTTDKPAKPPKSSQRSADQGLHLSKPKPAAPVAERAVEEQRKRADFEARQRDIRSHRESIEKRNAERAARKKMPATPLPVPPEVSASAVR